MQSDDIGGVVRRSLGTLATSESSIDSSLTVLVVPKLPFSLGRFNSQFSASPLIGVFEELPWLVYAKKGIYRTICYASIDAVGVSLMLVDIVSCITDKPTWPKEYLTIDFGNDKVISALQDLP
jgi:hypothetical protein